MGIEPTQSAWKAEVLPLNYTRLVTVVDWFSFPAQVVVPPTFLAHQPSHNKPGISSETSTESVQNSFALPPA